ncbi:hypothetical protein PSTT_11903, partial [Puccinia striiformis]
TIDFTKIKEFLQNGSVYLTPLTTNLYLLSAWSHRAKTANPGIAQTIALGSQPNMLCPLRAVEQRLAEAGSGPTSLFGYNPAGLRVHLTRRRVDRLQQLCISNYSKEEKDRTSKLLSTLNSTWQQITI